MRITQKTLFQRSFLYITYVYQPGIKLNQRENIIFAEIVTV